jgi:low temperature requirement protein LtrA
MSDPPPPAAEPGIQRVSTVELFFDLVFVFAITQLTSLVAHLHGVGD